MGKWQKDEELPIRIWKKKKGFGRRYCGGKFPYPLFHSAHRDVSIDPLGTWSKWMQWGHFGISDPVNITTDTRSQAARWAFGAWWFIFSSCDRCAYTVSLIPKSCVSLRISFDIRKIEVYSGLKLGGYYRHMKLTSFYVNMKRGPAIKWSLEVGIE